VEYAGWWVRFGAALIDGVMVPLGLAAIAVGRNLVLFTLRNQIDAPFVLAFTICADLLMLVFILWYYPGQWAERGQTMGQRMLRVMVVRQDGEMMGFGQGLLRFVVGMSILDVIVLGLPIGYLWAAWDAKKQAWHDKVAGTVVVRV
jgi:uncharacterized RDD family membrane protein YckC